MRRGGSRKLQCSHTQTPKISSGNPPSPSHPAPRRTRSYSRPEGEITVIRKGASAYLLSRDPQSLVSALTPGQGARPPPYAGRGQAARPGPGHRPAVRTSSRPLHSPRRCPLSLPGRPPGPARGRPGDSGAGAHSGRRRAAGRGFPASPPGGARRPRAPDSRPGAPVTQCLALPPFSRGDNSPREPRGDLREGGARSFRGAGIRSAACARPQPSRV